SSARQSISAAIRSNRALRPLPATILCSAKLRCRASFRHILTPPPPPPLFLIIPAQVMQRSLGQVEGLGAAFAVSTYKHDVGEVADRFAKLSSDKRALHNHRRPRPSVIRACGESPGSFAVLKWNETICRAFPEGFIVALRMLECTVPTFPIRRAGLKIGPLARRPPKATDNRKIKKLQNDR